MVSSTDTGWILTNALVTYAIGFDANGDLVFQDLRRTGDTQSWRPARSATPCSVSRIARSG